MKTLKNIKFTFFLIIILMGFLSAYSFALAQTSSAQTSHIQVSNSIVSAKVAPGEILPISVKLSNFGSNSEIDVQVKYSITNGAGNEIYESDETVAVGTTSSFVKMIQIPFDAAPGIYTSQTSIYYEGQLVPAFAKFSFVVERKFFDIYQDDLTWYVGLTALISIFMFALGLILVRRRRNVRLVPLDYSYIPSDKRIFYEILSDTITQMRQHAGDKALVIASNIEGLEIEKITGRVLAINGSPSKIIATLVSEYERVLGKKSSFHFRNIP